MPNPLQIRRGLYDSLPVLSPGEFGLSTDTKELFIGTPSGNIKVATDSQIQGLVNSLGNKVNNTFNTAVQTITTDMANLRAAIDSLPKYLDRNITINVNAGTASAGTLTIERFSGPGTLTVACLSHVQNSHNVERIAITACTNLQVAVSGFTCTAISGNCIAVDEVSGAYTRIENCYMVAGASSTSGFRGIYASAAHKVYVTSCVISNKAQAVYSTGFSHVETNALSGESNSIIYYSTSGARIVRRSEGTITGTTINSVAAVGDIRDTLHSSGWHVQNGLFPSTRTISNVAMADLQTVINSLPKYLDRDVTINCAAGTLSGQLTITRFCGPGRLTLNGSANSLATTRNIGNVLIESNTCEIVLNGFNVTGTSGNVVSVGTCSHNTTLYYLRVVGGSNSTSGHVGIRLGFGQHLHVANCQVSNKQTAFQVNNGLMTVVTCSGASNINGYHSLGGVLLDQGNTITATNMAAVTNGGIVGRGAGAILGA